MSQSSARHHSGAGAHDEHDEDAADLRAPRPEHKQAKRPRRPVDQPDGDGGLGPDEPDEGEFDLIGDDDLGIADLGPAAPNFHDPDTGSGRMRK
jgi:hypothetical protein